jgi:glucose/arabinose dehydrogenase
VGERPGRIRLVGKDGKASAPLGGLPEIWARGPQGLFEVLPDRDFAKSRTLYLTYTALPQGTNASSAPRLAGVLIVARARLSDDSTRLEDVKPLLNAEGIGGRAVQAADGTLLVSSSIPAGVGINSVDWPQPQQLDSLMGKILRINTDGSVPKDNPFVGRANARPEIYALGIRDDQGMALHPRTGTLWVSEHGPRGGDEINAIEKGKDYGFPAIGYGHEYTGKPIHEDRTAAPGMEQPVYFWTPGHRAGRDSRSLRAARAWLEGQPVRVRARRQAPGAPGARAQRVVAEERLLLDLDVRVRDVHEGPDGALYVMTDGNDGQDPAARSERRGPLRTPDEPDADRAGKRDQAGQAGERNRAGGAWQLRVRARDLLRRLVGLVRLSRLPRLGWTHDRWRRLDGALHRDDGCVGGRLERVDLYLEQTQVLLQRIEPAGRRLLARRQRLRFRLFHDAGDLHHLAAIRRQVVLVAAGELVGLGRSLERAVDVGRRGRAARRVDEYVFVAAAEPDARFAGALVEVVGLPIVGLALDAANQRDRRFRLFRGLCVGRRAR